MSNAKISERIRDIRKREQLSQSRFGFKIGVSSKSISAYENGRCKPPLRVLEKISKTYDTSLIELDSTKKRNIESKIGVIKEYLTEIENILSKSQTI